MVPRPEDAEKGIGKGTSDMENEKAASNVDDTDPSVLTTERPAPPGSRTFHRVTGAILLLAAAYVGYERIGTSANADQITHVQSYGDDAVVIGMTDEQPGFVLLAQLPASHLSIDASIQSNWLTGKRTHLSVRTPAGVTSIRLRQPLAILVRQDGTVIKTPVPWTHDEFDLLLHAADCTLDCREHLHRCGQPLDDIAHTLSSWREDRVPRPIREFLNERENSMAQVDASTREFHHE